MPTARPKAKSNPQFDTGFEGLNLYQQRYARGGNQFSVEPPDQGLCVGNGYVVEAVNDVLNVFNARRAVGAAGQHRDEHRRRLPAEREPRRRPQLVLRLRRRRSTARPASAGQFVTDPSCLYDAATQRFFVVVLTLRSTPTTARSRT